MLPSVKQVVIVTTLLATDMLVAPEATPVVTTAADAGAYGFLKFSVPHFIKGNNQLMSKIMKQTIKKTVKTCRNKF